MNTGIYQIQNIINNKRYIGQSVNLKDRKYRHFYTLRNNKHENGRLQDAFNKHGEESFVFKIILYCEINELTYYEQKLVDLLNPEYNICLECVTSCIGVEHTEETKKKLSKSLKGRVFTEEHRRNLSIAGKLRAPFSSETRKKMSDKKKNLSEEVRRNMSEAQKLRFVNNPITEETKKRLSIANSGENNYWHGKTFSEEHIENLSKSHKGYVTSEETKEKLSEALKGRVFSEEHRKKLSEARKRRASREKELYDRRF